MRTETETSVRPENSADNEHHAASSPYAKLALAVTVNFLIMFALTYSGVNAWNEIFVNLNRFYMAVIMVSAMVPVMVLVMWKMFPNTTWNAAVLIAAAVVFVGSFAALRAEVAVGNEQFLRSMIPHHSIAIHTCLNANITDPEIADLCDQIIESQRSEIAQMKDILDRIDG
jgi:hypothetical protein